MTRAEFSDAELHDLAWVERSLLLCLIVRLLLEVVHVLATFVALRSGAFNSLSIYSWPLVKLLDALVFVTPIIYLYLYSLLVGLARLPFGWLYVGAAILITVMRVLGVFGRSFSPISTALVWLMMLVHIASINREIFWSRGIKIGPLGPRV